MFYVSSLYTVTLRRTMNRLIQHVKMRWGLCNPCVQIDNLPAVAYVEAIPNMDTSLE